MDITDFLAHNRKEEYLSGHYRETKSSEPIYFEYGVENERSSAYTILSQGLLTVRESTIIRTSWDLGWTVNCFVSTQDGKLWVINDFVTRVAQRNKNVSRLFKSNPATEYVISLVAVDNPTEIL